MDELKPGTVVGKLNSTIRWKLGAKLGAGSWGAVFECVQELGGPAAIGNAAQVQWAVKIVPIHGPKGPKLVKGKPKVSDEADLLNMEFMMYTNTLRWHPNLPVVAQSGSGDNGTHRWLVLQRMRGTLNGRLRHIGGATDPSTAATIALQLMDVLAHVHGAGFLYVDVNSDNVMISGPQPGWGAGINAIPPGSWSDAVKDLPAKLHAPLDQEGDRAYLLDFGLATRISMLAFGTGAQSRPAHEAGTPLYSATAAARGKQMSPRDDLESLGYLLAFMLGGKESLPWHASTSVEEATAGKLACTSAALATSVTRRNPAGGAVVKAYFAALDAIPYGVPKVSYIGLRAALSTFADKDGKLAFKHVGVAQAAKAPAKSGRAGPMALASPRPKRGKRDASAIEDDDIVVVKEEVVLSPGKRKGNVKGVNTEPNSGKPALSATMAGRPSKRAKGANVEETIVILEEEEVQSQGKGAVKARGRPKKNPKAYLAKPLDEDMDEEKVALPEPTAAAQIKKGSRAGHKSSKAYLKIPLPDDEDVVVLDEEPESTEATPAPRGRKAKVRAPERSLGGASSASSARSSVTPKSGRSARSSEHQSSERRASDNVKKPQPSLSKRLMGIPGRLLGMFSGK